MKSLLEQIESRLAVCAKATPGPWDWHDDKCQWSTDTHEALLLGQRGIEK